MMKRVPVNTAKQVEENPMSFLADAMFGGSEKAILNQEASGQRSFVESETLPIEFHPPKGKAILEAAGVRFLGPVDGDPIFQYVELPGGWRKIPTEHSMWSELVDGKGRVRAGIFYKAAFYDRNAHISLRSRYSIRFDYDKWKAEQVAVAHVMDCEKIIHSTKPISNENKPDYVLSGEAEDLAKKWLKSKYPDYENPAAYW